jgi:hypothetical protein
MGDGKLYDPESLTKLTKSEITERLTNLILEKAELEAQGMKPLNSESPTKENSSEDVASMSVANDLDQVNEAISIYENMFISAPEEHKYIEIESGSLNKSDTINVAKPETDCGMSSFMADSRYIQFVNRKDFDNTTGLYLTETEWENSASDTDKAASEKLKLPEMSKEEAQAITDKLLSDVGINYLCCEKIEKVTGGSSSFYGADIRIGNLIKGYRLQYVRKVAGVSLTYTNTESACNNDDSNAPVWLYERLTFIVNDTGIVEMVYQAPYKITETITEKSALLPFSKIKSVFEKMILINQDSQTKADIQINKAVLGLACIVEKDDLSSGLIIPVWDFFGTANYSYGDGYSESYTESGSSKSYLTINAIDGSIIDRSLGY